MFEKESDLVSAFCAELKKSERNRWIVYHETGGFDLLLVCKETEIQVGLEAKLSLNVKVLSQALPDSEKYQTSGPDYRGVLVPLGKVQHDLSGIAMRLGLGVVTVAKPDRNVWQSFHLPGESTLYDRHSWHPWLPVSRIKLPDYIPDVEGGKPSPIMLTSWKVRAIKLMVLLDRRGFVTRRDMKLLEISPTAWTQRGGYLVPDVGGYVRGPKTPDFRTQHPKNYAEIEADFEVWGAKLLPTQTLLEV